MPNPDKVTRPHHYCGRGGIEPIEFIVSNSLDFLEGNVIKYVFRAPLKNGIADLQKALQYLTWLIEREETNQGSSGDA